VGTKAADAATTNPTNKRRMPSLLLVTTRWWVTTENGRVLGRIRSPRRSAGTPTHQAGGSGPRAVLCCLLTTPATGPAGGWVEGPPSSANSPWRIVALGPPCATSVSADCCLIIGFGSGLCGKEDFFRFCHALGACRGKGMFGRTRKFLFYRKLRRCGRPQRNPGPPLSVNLPAEPSPAYPRPRRG